MDWHPCVICAHPATQKCSGCKKVYYCSKEHQTQAWKKHKRLCAIWQKESPPDPRGTYCGLCGKTGPLMRTECCNRTICDDSHLYRLHTFSNVSCARNHSRYTLCGSHSRERHDKAVNWRDCTKCTTVWDSPEMNAAQGTSSFNFIDDVWNPPKFEPTKCQGCSTLIKMNAEATSRLPGSSGYLCHKCTSKKFGSRMPGGGSNSMMTMLR